MTDDTRDPGDVTTLSTADAEPTNGQSLLEIWETGVDDARPEPEPELVAAEAAAAPDQDAGDAAPESDAEAQTARSPRPA
ncbi:MAG: hypothetical protein M3509_12630, partial [Chloroflexota bacterium]|nr:hypothetical protein [Chloroflexota bacterium]